MADQPYDPYASIDASLANLNDYFANQQAPQASPIDTTAPDGTTLEERLRQPQSFIGQIFDVLSRPQYAVAKFVDSMATDANATFASAMTDSLKELWAPKFRTSFEDTIKKVDPVFAAENPNATKVLGFIGNVVTDPLTYLGFEKPVLNLLGKARKLAELEDVGRALKPAMEIGGEKGFSAIESGISDIARKITAKVPEEAKVQGLIQANDFIPALENELKSIPSLWDQKGLTFLGKTIVPRQVFSTIGKITGLEKVTNLIKNSETALLAQEKIFKPITSLVNRFQDFEPWAKRAALEHERTLDNLSKEAIQQGSELITLSNKLKGDFTPDGRKRLGDMMGEMDSAGWYHYQDKLKEGEGIKVPVPTRDQLSPIGQEIYDKIGVQNIVSDQGQPLGRMLHDYGILTLDDVGGPRDRAAAAQIKKILQLEAKPVVRNLTPSEIEKRAFELTDQAAPMLREKVFQNVSASPAERQMVAELYRRYNDIMELGMQANILKHRIINYNPRIYEMIQNPTELIDNLPAVRSAAFPAGKARTLTPEEVVASGKNPVTDALALYTQRYLEVKKAIARKEHSDLLKTMFPDGIPERYAKDFRFIGEGDYGKGLTDGMRKGLQMYDHVTNMFRKFATSIRLAFGPKQLVQNTLQEAAVFGMDFTKAYDPARMLDTLTLMMMDSRAIPRRELVMDELGRVATDQTGNVIWKNSDIFDKFSKSRIANDFGEAMTMGQQLDELNHHGLLEGRNATGIETLKSNVLETLDQVMKEAGRTGGWDGLRQALGHASAYMDLPSMIENFNKVTTFLNAKALGYTGDEAAKLTYQALYDYAHGLSQFERRFARRIIPFYSFQRFAYPLVMKTLFTHPGRITVPMRSIEGLFSAFGKIAQGQDLTTQERYGLPGYLLEKNFVGRDPDMKAIFRYIPSLTPMDLFDTIESDDKGNFDFVKTLERGVLSQIAPLIKVPLEIAVGKNFFTDRSINSSENPRAGIIGKVDPDQFLKNLFSMTLAPRSIGGQSLGLAGLAAGQLLGAATPSKARDLMLKLIGWEQGIDPKTGDPTVYVNPYTMLMASEVFPSLNQAIRVAKDRPMIDNWLELMTGQLTQRVDTKKAFAYKIKYNQNHVADLRRQYMDALKQQRWSEADHRKQELEDFVAAMMKDYADVQSQPFKLF